MQLGYWAIRGLGEPIRLLHVLLNDSPNLSAFQRCGLLLRHALLRGALSEALREIGLDDLEHADDALRRVSLPAVLARHTARVRREVVDLTSLQTAVPPGAFTLYR